MLENEIKVVGVLKTIALCIFFICPMIAICVFFAVDTEIRSNCLFTLIALTVSCNVSSLFAYLFLWFIEHVFRVLSKIEQNTRK